jgi:hypothetical protein
MDGRHEAALQATIERWFELATRIYPIVGAGTVAARGAIGTGEQEVSREEFALRRYRQIEQFKAATMDVAQLCAAAVDVADHLINLARSIAFDPVTLKVSNVSTDELDECCYDVTLLQLKIEMGVPTAHRARSQRVFPKGTKGIRQDLQDLAMALHEGSLKRKFKEIAREFFKDQPDPQLKAENALKMIRKLRGEGRVVL